VVTLKTAIPPFSNDANFYPDMTQKWGLSFLINTEETAEGRSAGSLAWAGLANSYYWIDPLKGVCGVWSTQLVPFADDDSLQNFRDFERAVHTSL
jgi:CubicO group peptidase (beta-lactamase class C family)